MNTFSIVSDETKVTQDDLSVESKRDLEEFLAEWDRNYQNNIKCIDLFNPELVRQWSNAQWQYFAKVFYHSRGHFRDLLWYLGNFAPDKEIKDIILGNIAEEFNGNSLSHEQLYLDYARSLGVDLKSEFLDQKFYIKQMYDFNESHLRWAVEHDWNHCFSAFSAYERLDQADYEFLAKMQESEHEFFTIHRKAEHFEKTCDVLQKIWNNNSRSVIEGFSFIAIAQEKMWRDLSDAIYTFKE